jgi:hypothetical protein
MWTHREIVIYLAATTFMGLATFLAVLVALFGKKFYPPKLKLRLFNDEGELTSFGQVQESTRYYHLEVSNERRWSPASDVSVHVTTIEQEGPDRELHPDWMGDVQIKWRFSKFYPAPSRIGKPFCFDLVSVKEDGTVLLQPIAAASSFKKEWKGPCRFRLWLKARAAEADSNWLAIEISWDGQWHVNSTDMKKHFIIKQVNQRHS